MAFLARLRHELATAAEVGQLLGEIESSLLVQDKDSIPAANTREIRRAYDRAVKLPKELVEEWRKRDPIEQQEARLREVGVDVDALRAIWVNRAVVERKEADPIWIPPDWLYAEVASEYNLKLRKIERGQPLKLADLPVGTGVQVFPQGKADNHNALIQLARIGDEVGQTGVVAFSAICTHLGCAVFAQLSPDGQMACPCNGSRFDPRRGATVTGGPADRPLPSLPITVAADGSIVADGDFSGPVGPR